MKLNLLHDRVAIMPIPNAEKSSGGILLPENAKYPTQKGKVIAVGPGLYQNGVLVSTTVKVGDTVIVLKDAGIEMQIDGEKIRVAREGEVITVFEE